MPAVLGTKLRRVARFFGITDQEYAYWLSQVIVPTFDVAPFLVVPSVKTATVTPSGVGNVVLLTVPPAKRWKVHSLRIVRAGGDGAYTIVQVVDEAGVECGIANAAGGSDFTWQPGSPLPLSPGFSLRVYVSVWTSGDTSIQLYVEEEDA